MVKYSPNRIREFSYPVDISQRNPEQLRELYFNMLRIRRIEEAIESRYHEDEMKSPIHLVIGQEAASVGVCALLAKEDKIFCGHRTHGVYLAKGGDLKAMLSELYCRIDGCVGSRGGSMHLMDKSVGMEGSSAIVAGIVPIAAGFAWRNRLRAIDRPITVFLGDAATEEGVFWETLNFATLKKLPIIFVCENNYYSVCTPQDERQAGSPIHERVAGFGINSQVVDGTNVLLVMDAMDKAKQCVAQSKGPAFLEIQAYRWRGHGGAGDDSASGYRDVQEVKDWQEHCPIEKLQALLVGQGLLDEQQRQAFEQRIDEEIEAAFTHAQNAPVPQREDLERFVYA